MKKEALNIDKLFSKDPKVKYGFAKGLLKTGAENPLALYHNYEDWDKLMHGDNKILRWTAIDIIGYLSAVDNGNNTEERIDDLLHFLHGGHLVTCNHAIFALGLIAKHKKDLREKIIKELIAVEKDEFNNQDCRAIAMGKVLESLQPFAEDIKDNHEVIKFVNLSLESHWPATKKKATKLVKKLNT